MRDHNRFKIGSVKYRWGHQGGDVVLFALINGDLLDYREGTLRLDRGEWVLVRGRLRGSIPTGTSSVVEAKKIVQVRLAMAPVAAEGGGDEHKSL